MHTQPIPISVICAANNSGQFNTLRVWMVIKDLFKRNTVIYNFTYERLSELTGISHTSLRKHVKIMLANGWAKLSGKNLLLTGVNKLKKHPREKCIPVPVCEKKSEQVLYLRKVIIHINIDNQNRRIKRKREILNKCKQAHARLTKSELKLIKQAGGVRKLENSVQSVTTLSNRSIGKLFFTGQKILSQITGHRIQKQLREHGLITTRTRLTVVANSCSTFDMRFMNSRIAGGFIYNHTTGIMYKRLSNEITLTPMH